jgi:hypothetical protein
VSEATGRNLIDHGQRIHVEFQGHLLRWKRWTFFFNKFTMVKSSSLQPWRLWSICWTLPIEIDQTISNQPHYPSGETIFLFSKVSWVSAVGLWLRSDRFVQSLSMLCLCSSFWEPPKFDVSKQGTKAYCTCRWKNPGVKRDEKSFKLEIPEDICRMR